ncbi:MAG: hypothetical protein HYU66_07600, partial [Armatimonadetes bacterium]|nr:hypothetical protein [Armatimonadota bacterium]
MKLIARLLQRSGEKRTAKLRCVVESHLGRAWRPLANAPDTVDLPTGQPVEVPLLAGPLPRGLYRFWVEAADQASGDVTRA